MGNCWVRMSSSMQLWLIKHENCITKLLLHIMYSLDVLAYTISGPLNFLSRRGDMYGQNFAALGRIIVGDYDKCTELIESPQQRGKFLGRAKLIPGRLPKYFPLFMSDAEAGGGDLHATIHKHFWETLIPPAFERTSDPVFDGYVKNMVAEVEKKGGLGRIGKQDMTKLCRDLVIKYVFHALFGLSLNKKQIRDVGTLFFGGSPFSSFVLGALKPWGTPFGCCQCKRDSLFNSLVAAVYDSPALQNYTPSAETANMSKDDYAEMVLTVAAIAGCLGTTNLVMQVVTAIPPDYVINLDDKKAVMLAVLEAARLKSPVNNVNLILQNPLTLEINGEEHTFKQGTVVAASIGLASVDPNQFPNPDEFDPTRENLMKTVMNFNHVGFDPAGSGTRQCPGRNIAMKLGTTLLVELRKDNNIPEQA